MTMHRHKQLRPHGAQQAARLRPLARPAAGHSAPGALERAQASGGYLTPADVQVLQRAAGNRAVLPLVRPQATLTPRRDIVQRSIFGSAAGLPKEMRKAHQTYQTDSGSWWLKKKVKALDNMVAQATEWLNVKRIFFKKTDTRKRVTDFKEWAETEKADLKDFDAVKYKETEFSLASSIPAKIDGFVLLNKRVAEWKAKHQSHYKSTTGNLKKAQDIIKKWGFSPTKIAHAKKLRTEIQDVVEAQKRHLKLGDKMLDMSVILELVDVVHHRTGRFLQEAFDFWLKAKTSKDFWDWTTNVHLPRKYPGAEYKVQMLTPEELENKRVTFKEGKAFHRDTPLTMPKGGGKHAHYNKIIYVMNSSYTFYATQETYASSVNVTERFHHSSFFGGAPVRAAGTLEMDNESNLKGITPESGHYVPGPVQMIHAVVGLANNKVNLANITVAPEFRATAIPAKRVRDRLFKEQQKGWTTEPTSRDRVARLCGIKLHAKQYNEFIRNKIKVP